MPKGDLCYHKDPNFNFKIKLKKKLLKQDSNFFEPEKNFKKLAT